MIDKEHDISNLWPTKCMMPTVCRGMLKYGLSATPIKIFVLKNTKVECKFNLHDISIVTIDQLELEAVRSNIELFTYRYMPYSNGMRLVVVFSVNIRGRYI